MLGSPAFWKPHHRGPGPPEPPCYYGEIPRSSAAAEREAGPTAPVVCALERVASRLLGQGDLTKIAASGRVRHDRCWGSDMWRCPGGCARCIRIAKPCFDNRYMREKLLDEQEWWEDA